MNSGNIKILSIAALTTISLNSISSTGVKEVVSTIVNSTFNTIESTLNSSVNKYANQFGSGETQVSISNIQSGDVSFDITTVQPLTQTDNKSETLFFQGSLNSYKNHGESRPTINLGIGKRWLGDENTTITGVNAFYDYESKSNHSRASIGAEYKKSAFEAGTNIYWGLTGKKSVTVNGIAEDEQVLDGWDINAKGQLPYLPWARLTANHYKWKKSDNSTIDGGKYGLEFDINSMATLEVGTQNDNEMNRSSYVTLSYEFGPESKPTNFAIDSVAFRDGEDMTDHLLDKVKRQNKIITSRASSDSTNDCGGILVDGICYLMD